MFIPFIFVAIVIFSVIMAMEIHQNYLIVDKDEQIMNYMEVREASDDFHLHVTLSTDEARVFVLGQGFRHYEHYKEEEACIKALMPDVERLLQDNLDEEAMKVFEQAIEQNEAMSAEELRNAASALLFSDAYEELKTTVTDNIYTCTSIVTELYKEQWEMDSIRMSDSRRKEILTSVFLMCLIIVVTIGFGLYISMS